MKNKLTFKDFIKTFSVCGVSLLALIIAYNILELFFVYIYENKEAILLPVSNINLYVKEILNNIVLYLILANAWFFCGYFKLLKFFDIPKYITLTYYLIVTLNLIVLLFSLFNFEILYTFFFTMTNFIVVIIREELIKVKNQLEIDI